MQRFKIQALPEIIRTFKIFKKGMQFCINKGWKNKINNNIRLHPFVYKHLRSIGLPSQIAVSCIKQSCGILKKAKTKPIIKKCSIKYNFPRNALINGNLLSLSTVKGRVKVPFSIPKCYAQYFSWNLCESLLRIDRKGRAFFLFCFKKDISLRQINSAIGIDVGINNLAVVSDNQFFRNGSTKQINRKFNYLRSILQTKGTKSAKRLLKKLSGRQKRFMAWRNHNISKEIVSNCKAGTIIMEDLKGIKKRRKGKRMNKILHGWSFLQLQNFINYKAEREGIKVIKINPYMTSQICSKCHKVGTRIFGFFHCVCGYSLNADLNSAQNLAQGIAFVQQASVTKPNVSDYDSKVPLREIADEFRGKFLKYPRL